MLQLRLRLRILTALALAPLLAVAQTPAPSRPAVPAPTQPPIPAPALAVPALIPEPVLRALASEVSGTSAKHTVQELTLFHRMRGSRGLRSAAEAVLRRLREAGLETAELLELPADGQIFYGTQRSRPGWDAEFAELWEQRPAPGQAGAWVDAVHIASWAAQPVCLAQDSASGEAAAELVDVGTGASEQEYTGKDLRGKLALISGQPGQAEALAVGRFGAAGLISYAQNQKSAWWREDETLVRWGHLNTFPAPKTFAFMVSLKQARAWQERLARGEAVRLRASVRAGQHPGSYDIPTAVLQGSDPVLRDQEIVFSCHLDHLRPGANDNASGCAAILESARTLASLIRQGRIAPPRRTIRFVWPPEVEGTIALLNARPELAQRARAVIHMDMVGGDRSITKAVFHVTRSPGSLPSFVNDVAEELGRFVNEQSSLYADTGAAEFPLADPEGGKEGLQAEFVDFTEGSDHQVWAEGSWRVPAIYFNDWPDRYIHTNADTLGHIDATKLLRAAFLGAATAYTLAQLDSAAVPAVWATVRNHALERTARALARRDRVRVFGQTEADNLMRDHLDSERAVLASIARFAEMPPETRQEAARFLDGLEALVAGAGSPPAAGAEEGRVYRRQSELKGPMGGFGYNYLDDQLEKKALPRPALLAYEGLWGEGGLYGYEALNLVDGRRTVHEIRDRLSALYGPVPVDLVAGYLETLQKIGVLAGSSER